MDKTLAALLGAVGALASAGSAPAAAHATEQPANQTDILQVASYAELLRPIPNAVERLRLLEQTEDTPPQAADGAPLAYTVQYYRHHHHHHHHHRYARHHHHHHHHHHNDLARVLNHVLGR
jgi:hypothetical protein